MEQFEIIAFADTLTKEKTLNTSTFDGDNKKRKLVQYSELTTAQKKTYDAFVKLGKDLA